MDGSSPVGDVEPITLIRTRVITVLVAIAVTLFALHYAVAYARLELGYEEMFGFSIFLNLDEEASVMNFMQVFHLLVAAILLAVIAIRIRRLGLPHSRGWFTLTTLVLYLALDESAEIHEYLLSPQAVDHRLALIAYGMWAVVGVGLVLLLFITIPLLGSLDRHTRAAFVVAAILYLSGAVITDALFGGGNSEAGRFSRGYLLLQAPLEEALEVAGQLVLLAALLAYLARTQPPICLRFTLRNAADGG